MPNTTETGTYHSRPHTVLEYCKREGCHTGFYVSSTAVKCYCPKCRQKQKVKFSVHVVTTVKR